MFDVTFPVGYENITTGRLIIFLSKNLIAEKKNFSLFMVIIDHLRSSPKLVLIKRSMNEKTLHCFIPKSS